MGRSRRESNTVVQEISDRGWIERKPLKGDIIEEGNLRAEEEALQLLFSHGLSIDDIRAFVPRAEGLHTRVQLRTISADTVQFRAMLFDSDDMPVGKLVRTIDLKEKCAYQNSFSLDNPAWRQRGIGLQMFLAHLQLYKKAGLDRVELYAGSEVGGYFWARLGFRPASPEAGEVVRKRIKQRLEAIDNLLANTPSPEALSNLQLHKEFLQDILSSGDFHALAAFRPRGGADFDEDFFSGKSILLGSGWNAVFDLHSPKQAQALADYSDRSA